MKKVLKRTISFFLAFIITVTSITVAGFSAFAGSHEDTPALNLRSAIESFESKMDGKLYTNMSEAYEAYVAACRAYDVYYYGDGNKGETYTASQITTLANTLSAATGNMEEWKNDITYASAAADGSYTSATLATGGDELSGAIYAYGVGSNSGYTSQSDYIDRYKGVTQYGSVVLLYTGADQTYAFPVNFATAKNDNIFNANTRTTRWVSFAGSSNLSKTKGSYLNDGAFILKRYWHGHSDSATYPTSTSHTFGYGATVDGMWDDNTTGENTRSGSYYYANTLYYESVPASTLTTYSWLDYEYYTNMGYYAVNYPNQGLLRYNTTESTAVSGGSTLTITKNNTSGDAAQNIYILNYKTLTDAIDTYTSGNYRHYLTLGTDSATDEYYRNGGLSDYFAALDEMLNINPTDSSKSNNYNGTNYYISPSSTSQDIAKKVQYCAEDIDESIKAMETASKNATADAGRYINLRGDSDYNKGYIQLTDSNGGDIYGLDGLLGTYLNGNPVDPETNDGSLTYTEESWSIFEEAYELAQKVMKHGALNGYMDDYNASDFNGNYNNILLENVSIYNSEGNLIYDDSYLDEKTEESGGSKYYKQVYDRNGDGIVSAVEAIEALNRAYENLKLNYSVVDAALLQALLNEAKTLINSSNYFTDTSFSNSELQSISTKIETAVWGSEDSFGIDAYLPRANEENQAMVDEFSSELVTSINRLTIDEKKIVASAGNYSLDSVLSYIRALDKTLYTNWDEVLQSVIDEANYYLKAFSSSENEGGYNTSTKVKVDSSSAAAVHGSAYRYVTDYIDLVNRLYVGTLSLQVAFNAIENGTVANIGAAVTTEGYCSDTNYTNFWKLAMSYQKGMVYFRTSSSETVLQIPGFKVEFGTKANYDQMLDSININAGHDWGKSTTASSHGEIHSSTGSNWYLTDSEKATWNGSLNYKADYGSFDVTNLKISASTGRNTYDGYNNVDSNGNTGSAIGSSNDIGIVDKTFDYTDIISVTDGFGGSSGVLQGGVLTHSSDDSKSYGYVDLSGDFTYTMDEYEKQELNRNDTIPKMTEESANNAVGALFYFKVAPTLINTYYGYKWITVPYSTNITVVDVTYLFELIDEVKALDSSYYTTVSWDNLEAAYKNAIANMEYTNMTADEILQECIDRYQKLWDAYDSLIPVVNITASDCLENDITENLSNYIDYTFEKDDENNTVSIKINNVKNEKFAVDYDKSVTLVNQGETIHLVIHTGCSTTHKHEIAHCGANGYNNTLTYCNKCETTVSDVTEIIPATGEHNLGEWHYYSYATGSSVGEARRECKNEWESGSETVECQYYETKEIPMKKMPHLCIDYSEVSTDSISFSYPTIDSAEEAKNVNQYDIKFHYESDTADVLSWDVYFVDEDNETLNMVEGTDYILLENEDYSSGNDGDRYCEVIFLEGGSKTAGVAQAAWDAGNVIINANTASFPIAVSVKDCQGIDIADDISFDIYRNYNSETNTNDLVASNDKGNLYNLVYDAETGTYKYNDMSGIYTLIITDSNGYTLDRQSIESTSVGDRDYGNLQLVFHKSVSEQKTITDATCDKDSYATVKYICDSCQTLCSVKTENYPNTALGHDYKLDESLSKAATCTDDGEDVYVCQNEYRNADGELIKCGNTYHKTVYATGHSYALIDSAAPECNKEGKNTYRCTKCQEEIEVSTGFAPHNYIMTEVPATCTDDGYKEYTCSNCSSTFTSSTTKAKGHIFRYNSESSTPATCIAGGHDTYTCIENDSEYIVETEATGEHNWSEKEHLEATCTSDGYIKYECSECGEEKTVVLPSDEAHSFYEYESKPATCEENGSITLKCSECGYEIEQIIPAAGHKYILGKKVMPNCTDSGYNLYICKNCVDSYDITEDGTVTVVPKEEAETYEPQFDEELGWIENTGSYVKINTDTAYGHDWRITGSKQATCVDDGYIDFTCEVCGQTYRQTINATGEHVWNEGIVTVEPTCSSEGIKTYTCDVCGETKTENISTDAGHDLSVKESKEATCGEGGFTVYECKICGEIIREDLPATGHHNYKKFVVEPTCTEDGYTRHVCTVCGEESSTTDTTPKLGHDYRLEETVEATCSENGYHKYVCTECGAEKKITINKTENHIYKKEDSKEATCLEEGWIHYVCTVCQSEYYENIPVKDTHEWVVKESRDATCTEDGYTDYECDICGVTKHETVNATGKHNYTKTTISATCEENGYILYECTMCHDTFRTDETPSLGHKFREDKTQYKEPTCAEEGYKTYTCMNECGKSYIMPLEATGEHTWDGGTTTKEPTSTEPGIKTYECIICHERKEEIIAPSGHNWDNGTISTEATCTETGTMIFRCTDEGCEESYEAVIPPLGHEIVKTGVNPTCEENGYALISCTRCDYEAKTDIVAAKGHHYREDKEQYAAPTCKNEGHTVYVCANCQNKYEMTIPATGDHDFGEIEHVNASCQQSGWILYECSVCKETYTEILSKDSAHEWEMKEEKKATCTEDGYINYECLLCGETKKETLPATGVHEYKKNDVYASCEEKGYTEHTCIYCGESYITDYTAPLGHAYRLDAELSVSPTCGEEGKNIYICHNKCGSEMTETIAPTGNHIWDGGTVTREPTSTEEGIIEYECEVCHQTKEEVILYTGHEWDDGRITKEPTCTEDGEIIYTCTDAGCDQTYTGIIPKLGHDIQSDVYSVSCTTDGYTHNHCTRCDYEYDSNIILSTGHHYRITSNIEPTCAENGKIVYECSKCFDIKETEIEATGEHSWNKGVVTTEATCNSEGIKTYTCEQCGKTEETVIPMKNHTIADNDQGTTVKEATCTDDGEVMYVCAECGESFTAVIPAAGHSMAERKIKPTCETDGYIKHYCLNCDYSYKTDAVAATGHAMRLDIENSKEATCGEDGYDLYVCENKCGKETMETIPATGEHIWDAGTITKEATSTEPGITTYECIICHETKEEAIAPLGHNWDNGTITTEPTCTEKGIITYKCLDEGCSITHNEYVDPLGHDMRKKDVNPTCEDEGYTHHYCSRCDYEYNSDALAATGHAYRLDEELSNEPTCTAAGRKVYVCDNGCGKDIIESIDATGVHVWDKGTVTKPATCTEKGERTYTCSFCGEVYTEEIPTIDHSWNIDEDASIKATCETEGINVYICENCGATYSENILALGHDYKKTGKKDAGCEDEGYTEYTCQICGSINKADIKAPTGHKYRENKDKYLAPECGTAGRRAYICEECGNEYDEEISPTGNHTWDNGFITKPATSTEPGERTYTCQVCGQVHIETIPPTGHTWDNGSITVEATCTESGEIVFTCTDVDCNQTHISATPPLGHDLKQTFIKHDCTEEGYTIYSCSRCDYEYKTDYTAPTGHHYREDTSLYEAPTCSADGSRTYVCDYCGDSYSVPVSATGTGNHTWDSGTVHEASHTEKGYTEYTCTECGETYKTDYTSTVPYVWSDWEVTKEATCTEEGIKTRYCNCGNDWCTATETQTIAIDASSTGNHTFEVTIELPTCTKAGYTLYTCKDCGFSYEDDIVPASGHHYIEDTNAFVAPTCSKDGSRTYVCEYCNDVDIRTIKATGESGHSYTKKVTPATCTSKGYTIYTCIFCGDSYKDNYTSAKGHTWDTANVKYVVKATRNREGQKQYTCSVCKATKTVKYAKIASWSIGKTEYTYNGKKITPTIKVYDENGNKISSKYYVYQIYSENTSNKVGSIKNVGKYYIKATFKDKYEGSIVVGELTVRPKSRQTIKVSAVTQGFKASWTALNSDQITGYQVQYSTSKDFSSKKTVTVSKRKTSSKKVTGLKSKKKYYVRVRTYLKKKNGTTYYSVWSPSKTVMTK